MAKNKIVITVKMPGLDRMRKAIQNNAALSARIAKAWSTIYRAFTRQRFVRLSRGGGGEWKPLAPSTLKRRRGGGQGAAILRDTGALLASLQPSLGGGSILKTTPRPLGFTAFLGGGNSYKSGATLSEVAKFHHAGGGNLPSREILIQPDRSTVDTMVQHGKRIITDALNNR